jgi:hypothetical protein
MPAQCLINDPSSPISKPIAKKLVVHDAADIQRIYRGSARLKANR